jgi:hypothetical protein
MGLVTAPLSSPVIPTVEPPAAVRVPASWLLEHGSWPVRVRTLVDLAPNVGDAAAVQRAAYLHAPALRLAVQQSRDGTWGGRLLSVAKSDDPTFAGVGAIPAVRRLLEYGWEPDAPTFHCARRLLFRLLAEDVDPAFLFELREETGDDELLVRRGRAQLREGAAAALAHLGAEADPRLRGAAVRALERVMTFVRGAATAEPTSVLPPSATPPTEHFLVMLAFMPRFRSEHQDEVSRLLAFLSAPPPSGAPRQLFGKREVPQPHLVLGDPIANVSVTASLPSTLAWLELLARLGFIRRNPEWNGLLDRLLEERDANGVWRGRTTTLAPPQRGWDWPTFPLGDPDASRESMVADVTFRLALIARLAGRPLELV